jgi:hypothetical protein
VTADERYRRWIDWLTRIENETFSLFLAASQIAAA